MKANRNYLKGEISYNTILCYLVSFCGGKKLHFLLNFLPGETCVEERTQKSLFAK